MFSRLKHLEFNVPAVRGTMRNLFFPEARWTTLRWGPLRGMKIQNRADVNLHLLIGAWELRSFALLTRVFQAVNASAWQGIAADVGGNMGAYSFWLNRVLPNVKTIYAFEPSPETVVRLRQNLAASNASRVQVIQAACIDQDRPVEFFIAHHHHSSSIIPTFAHGQVALSERTSVQVRGIALDSLLADSPLPVHFIKIDVEGGAIQTLPGAAQTITNHRPLILIESHTPDEDHAISHMLITNNYDAFRLDDGKWVTQKNADHTNPDGVYGTMLCVPAEQSLKHKTILS